MTQESLRFQQESRCGNKKAYRNGRIADEKAEQASRTANELIISYQCPDCGWWHIGHPNYTQLMARDVPPVMNCDYCGDPIPVERFKQAQKDQVTVTTCSSKCTRRRAEKRRRQARRRAQAAARAAGSEGGIPGPA